MGYTRGSSLSGSVTKEVKFIKAKEQIEVNPIVEKPKMEEKRNVDDKWMVNISNLWAGLNPEPSLVPDHKEVLDQPMCVTTADFKGTLDQIVKS